MMAQLLAVSKCYLPEEFGENGTGEVRVLPGTVLEEFDRVVRQVRVLDHFFDETVNARIE